MVRLEIAHMSTRGQMVIPLATRKKMNLADGDKFMVITDADTIILKKIKLPPLKSVQKVLGKAKTIAQEHQKERLDLEKYR